MRALHFDCFSGISGDMTLAALLSAGAEEEKVRQGLASLGLPLQLEVEKTSRGSFAALALQVKTEEDQPHRYLKEVTEIIERGQITSGARELALRIFRKLAEAEAEVHGIGINEVHFHEVGALDSIADIVGVSIALDSLGIQRYTSRSVPTGLGTVKAAHGVMPVPTPAPALLLRGVPLAASNLRTELTTPTGAAILATLVQEWCEAPVMRIERIGMGAGQKDFPQQANILRVFIGRVDLPSDHDSLWVVETNIDDVSPEIIGYCFDRLFAAGAVDVFTQPLAMKKNRPGVLLTALTPDTSLAAVEEILFRETMTFGVRRYQVQRSKLQRKAHAVQTRWGRVQGKLGWHEGQRPIFTPEYDDCARVARQESVPLREVYEEVRRAYEQGEPP
jgi:pyridinium-3,5-bisthiocarboxylic acid mononucleotide nickel chelatase